MNPKLHKVQVMKVIFFDGNCPLCHTAVRFILGKDCKKTFYFASLQGETAAKHLHEIAKDPNLDTLVLMEGVGTKKSKTYIEGRAVLRICSYLKFPYSFLGLLSYLPSAPFDAMYRFIAKRRTRLFKKAKPLTGNELKDRFLS